MNKTPVSILQEMMAKQHITPNYELIFNGGGTHDNQFTYRVACEGLSATGTGRCKKDAKHKAAKAMVETIVKHRAYPELPASPAKSPIKTPLVVPLPVSPSISTDMPFINAIGSLQALCTDNNLRDPEYILISEDGPPHARQFTYHCVVSTFKEEGVATTKKQAKHEAAKKMLDKIKELVVDVDKNNILKEKSEKKEIIASEIAKVRYPELSVLSIVKKVNLGLKISEYHTKLKNDLDENTRKKFLEKLRSFLPDNSSDKPTIHVLPEFKNLLSTINVEITSVPLRNEKNVHIIGMYINSSPSIFQIGVGMTAAEAESKVILQSINTLILFLM